MDKHHNGYEIIGQIKSEDKVFTRTMSIYTKETYQQVWARAAQILVDAKSADQKEHLMNFTVKPITGNRNFPSEVGEIMMPPVDQPHPVGVVVQHPRFRPETDRYGRALRTAAEIAVARLQEAVAAGTQQRPLPGILSEDRLPVVKNVVVKVPDGVSEVTVETPTVTTLDASDKEGEVCFS